MLVWRQELRHLRPDALVGGERVDANIGAHGVELRAEGRVRTDVLPAPPMHAPVSPLKRTQQAGLPGSWLRGLVDVSRAACGCPFCGHACRIIFATTIPACPQSADTPGSCTAACRLHRALSGLSAK